MRSWRRSVFDSPILRRVRWHVKRIASNIDRGFFLSLIWGLFFIVGIAGVLAWLAETDGEIGELGESLYWAGATVLGIDSHFVTATPVGWALGWGLGLFGVAIVATMTGALVGFVIDLLLKEGQGMGASGYTDHIVICGWNATARDLIAELSSDHYDIKMVLLHQADKSPAKDSVYFVNGSGSDEADLKRAGIEHAKSAIVCPSDGSDEADLRSILTVLAIESIAPEVRTVVEVNNPANVAHFRRANVDEILVTSKLASHLLARSAIYPGLSELVTDIVSGGEGSELYRVDLPEEMAGKQVRVVSAAMLADYGATLLAVSRNGSVHTNPASDFEVQTGDDLVVVAESLGALRPLTEAHAFRE